VSGIYLHIPFCKQACHYCNFHFSTSLRFKNELINALLKEIEIYSVNPFPFRSGATGNENKAAFGRVETIYLGGGTPSLLEPGEIALMLDKIKRHFSVEPGTEITLEANPDDISEEKLIRWRKAGVNRLSIGVQSFFAEDLQWMNRAHDAAQAIKSLELAVKHFDNITIDLIYGSPDLTDRKWKENVDRAIAVGIPHLSCYALTVEPKTPLEKRIRQLQSKDVNPDNQSLQFTLLMEWMGKAGYEHYEISNFAKPGYRSRHNSSYWSGKPYIGLGPSAHSFDGNIRWWNVANNKIYTDSIEQSKLPAEAEVLTPTQKLNEKIMISLRTSEGLDLAVLDNDGRDELIANAKKYLAQNLAVIEDHHLKLTREGKLVADGIAANLFVD
jgi:oxygen-independent coproporphyrinogen III oxidase